MSKSSLVNSTLPRGIRNKNPLNLRIGNDWIGEVAEPDDPDFEQFTSMVFGLRAGFIVLRRYITRYGRNTIAKIVESWAPRTENRTDIYIRRVAGLSGISPSAVLSFDDRASMVALVSAMIVCENGMTIPAAVIREAYDLVCSH